MFLADKEAIMDRLFTPEFMEVLNFDPHHYSTDIYDDDAYSSSFELPEIKRCDTPPFDSPFNSPVRRFEFNFEIPEFDENLQPIIKTKSTNDSGFSYNASAHDDSDDEMVIPELDFDYDFSMDGLNINSGDEDHPDDSLIEHW
jgi:hypothetical protein